jgi:acyl-CoA synthetase (AMP-forming)/AMP-acid ligase II
MSWNFSSLVSAVGKSSLASSTALIHGNQSISYGELDQRSDAIGSYFTALELSPGSHIGHLMRNSNVYMETFIGCGKSAMSHVNINYRYQCEELAALCDSLDIRVLVYDSEFSERVKTLQQTLPGIIAFVEVTENAPTNDFAIKFSDLYTTKIKKPAQPASSDDYLIIATGGTTGLPKGVQWRHEDLWRSMNISMSYDLAPLGITEHPASIEQHVANLEKIEKHTRFMPLSPLMHGAGLMASLMVLGQAGTIITVDDTRFDANRVLDTINAQRPHRVALVGDAFARPLIEALDKRRDEQLLSPLEAIISTGASLSDDCKQALQSHKPELVIVDTLGSSEAAGFAISSPSPGCFIPSPTTKVFNEKGEAIQPGSHEIGMLAKGGYIPSAYYNEPEKSAETFTTIKGDRYVLTGDRARVHADGLIELLGRDSTCINTGGEKVYTVEVERVLISHPKINDALVIGLPHQRFGKVVVAVIETPEQALDTDAIKSFAKQHLADYKVPRLIFTIDSLQRAANGKPNYPLITQYAEQQQKQLEGKPS